MPNKMDKAISVISVVLACLFLVYCTVNTYLSKEGSVAEKIISTVDTSSNFTQQDKETINMILKTTSDKDVVENIKKYVEADDEKGLEEYLETLLSN